MILKYRLKKYYVKAVREKKPPEYIAKGWAIGMCIGCAIPFGVQLYISIPLSFFFKASKIGATLGTFITNPFTIIFLYPAQCWLGARILGKNIEYGAIASQMKQLLVAQDWASLSSLSGTLVTSFFAGGFIFAAVLTPLTYYGMLLLVRRYRDERARLRRERVMAFIRKRLTPRNLRKDSPRQ